MLRFEANQGGPAKVAEQLADEWSFLLWQFGDPEFPPAQRVARNQ